VVEFSFTAPGQPVTTNHGYKTGRVPVKRGGRPVLTEDMTQRYINRPILTDEAIAWRGTVEMMARLAKPSRWVPTGQLRVLLDFRVAHYVDADGCFKFILDGLKRAIDYDDRYFLPCARSMESGRKLSEACVIVTVEEIL
jgi:hypothetical protein